MNRCNYYVYPSVDTFPNARGTDGYYYDITANQQIRIRPFIDEYIRNEIDVLDLALLDEEQVRVDTGGVENGVGGV